MSETHDLIIQGGVVMRDDRPRAWANRSATPGHLRG